MELSKEFPEAVNLKWKDAEWAKPIDYEHIPFRCRQFHDYGHFIRNFPKKGQQPPQAHLPQGMMEDKEGFVQVWNMKKTKSAM